MNRKLKSRLKHALLYAWNFWPPFVGAGIVITRISPDFRQVEAKLKKRPWTANYFGTQYGGSIFSLTDPFYPVMLFMYANNRWVIWDKAAAVRYLKPGRTDLTATFILDDDTIHHVETTLAKAGKMELTKTIQIKDKEGDVVAEIDRVIYIRDKAAVKPPKKVDGN